jgi:hypothetical protein
MLCPTACSELATVTKPQMERAVQVDMKIQRVAKCGNATFKRPHPPPHSNTHTLHAPCCLLGQGMSTNKTNCTLHTRTWALQSAASLSRSRGHDHAGPYCTLHFGWCMCIEPRDSVCCVLPTPTLTSNLRHCTVAWPSDTAQPKQRHPKHKTEVCAIM